LTPAPLEDEELCGVPGYATPVQRIHIDDAPFGTRVFQASSSNTWLETKRYPIDSNSTYWCYGNLRWLGDNSPATYYFTVYEYNLSNKNLGGDGTFYHYHHSGKVLPSNKWIHVKFPLGLHGHPHHADAKYFSIGAGVNYTGGNGTHQYNGFYIVRVPQ